MSRDPIAFESGDPSSYNYVFGEPSNATHPEWFATAPQPTVAYPNTTRTPY